MVIENTDVNLNHRTRALHNELDIVYDLGLKVGRHFTQEEVWHGHPAYSFLYEEQRKLANLAQQVFREVMTHLHRYNQGPDPDYELPEGISEAIDALRCTGELLKETKGFYARLNDYGVQIYKQLEESPELFETLDIEE